jgi:elongation factor Ts
MSASVESIKKLRSITSASVSDCKSALQETSGDIQKAAEWLRQKGLERASKRQDRVSREGRIEAYVHLGNKIGVILEVDCETDFVARNSDFCQFTKDIALQIAASRPAFIKKEDVPQDLLAQEKDKELFFKNNCLLEQVFIKDPSIAIKDYLGSTVVKLGENIVIRRFTRYQIGE